MSIYNFLVLKSLILITLISTTTLCFNLKDLITSISTTFSPQKENEVKLN